MWWIRRCFIWLTRAHKCQGFGIQSPTDYAFVREVINQHTPYYAYETFVEDDWLTRKLGRLYFRLANLRQPHHMVRDSYARYWKAGCRTMTLIEPAADTGVIELARLTVDDDVDAMLSRCDANSVLVIEGIYRNWERWHMLQNDKRVGTTFDLYYCGLLFFDKHRYGHKYKVNF